MEKTEFDKKIKNFDYALNELCDASHHIFEAHCFLEYTRDDKAETLSEILRYQSIMIDAQIKMVKDQRESFYSENYDRSWEESE
jgi:hypothetical protein